MEFFNIITGLASIISLLLSLYVVRSVYKIQNIISSQNQIGDIKQTSDSGDIVSQITSGGKGNKTVGVQK